MRGEDRRERKGVDGEGTGGEGIKGRGGEGRARDGKGKCTSYDKILATPLYFTTRHFAANCYCGGLC
jgi:hypothetical protein